MAEDEESGMCIVMSAPQLAAVLAGESIGQPATLSNRLWGGLRVVGGTLELLGAGALCLAPEPTMMSKAGCVVFGLHGTDTVVAGGRQVWTGRDTNDLTQTGATKLALALGAEPKTAERVGLAVDIGVPILMSAAVGAARLAAVRGGRISLIEHEAQAGSSVGGHTIAKHVGQTEAQLRTRLATQLHVPVASAFTSLSTAEQAISQILKIEAATIKAWVQAGTVQRLRLTGDLGKVVGQGVVRTTGQLVKMTKIRVVLQLQQYNGMPYFILTAFPIP